MMGHIMCHIVELFLMLSALRINIHVLEKAKGYLYQIELVADKSERDADQVLQIVCPSYDEIPGGLHSA